MIVIDASTVLEVLLGTPIATSIYGRIISPSETLHSPHLLDLEVAQVIRRYCRSKDMTAKRGQEALRDLADFPVIRYPHREFLPRIWELRENITAYDAVYIALAEVLQAPLVTLDGRLSRTPGHRATIELITESVK